MLPSGPAPHPGPGGAILHRVEYPLILLASGLGLLP
jgi:hypothetical protein